MEVEDKVELITLCAAIANGGNSNAFREYAVGSCIQDINEGKWDGKSINPQEVYKYVAKLYDLEYQHAFKRTTENKPGIEMIKSWILGKIKFLRIPQDEYRTLEYAKKRYSFANPSIKKKYGIEVVEIAMYSGILGGLISSDFGLKYPSTTNETDFFDNVDHTIGSDLPIPQEHYLKSYFESTVYDRKVLESMLTMYFCAGSTEDLTKFYLDLKDQVGPSGNSKAFDFVKPLKQVSKITDLLTLDFDSVKDIDDIVFNNPLRYKPLIAIENKILVPVPYLLADIPNSLCRYLAINSMPDGEYREKSGEAFSKMLQTELKYLLGKDNVFSTIKIQEKKGKPLGDIDICIKWRDKVVAIECKSVHLTKESLTNLDALAELLNSYIVKGYNQVKLSVEALNKNPNLIKMDRKIEKIIPIIVTEVPVSVINPDIFKNEYLSTFMQEDFPVYVIDSQSLIAILNKCYDGKEFIDFLEWRLSTIRFDRTQFMPIVETDSFVYYRLYGKTYTNRAMTIATVSYMGNMDRIENSIDYGNKFLGQTKL